MRQPTSIRAITLSAIQKHPNDTFKINDIVEAIRVEHHNALPDTIRNIISTDFSRLKFVKRITPYGGSIKGGVQYKITTLGRTHDLTKIPTGTKVRSKLPPLKRDIDDTDVTELPGLLFEFLPTVSGKVVDNTQPLTDDSLPDYNTVVPTEVTSTSQVIKREDGTYLKLEGKLDQIAIGEAIFEYISTLKVKILELTAKLESLSDRAANDRRFSREEIKAKNDKIEELELIVRKLRDCSIDTRKTFDLSEIVSIREERNK